MKAKVLLLFLVFVTSTTLASAELLVKKSTLIQSQLGVHNINISFAQNNGKGETFIVWQQSISTGFYGRIVGCIVNANGKLITPIRTLAKGTGIGSPSIAYNPIKDEYVVVYDSSFYGEKSELFANRLSSKGQQRGKEIKLQTDRISEEASDLAPKIRYNSTTNSYAIVWLRDDDENEEENGVFGGTYTQNLTRNGSLILIRKSLEWPKYPVAVDMAFLPGGEKLLIPMRQISEGEGESAAANYHLATLDPILQHVTQVKKINRNPVARETGWSATLAFSVNQSGLFYTENDGLKFRQIDSQGRATGNARAAFSSSKANAPLRRPATAFSTTAKGTNGLLIASDFSASGGTSWAQVLDSNARPIGAPIQIDDSAANEAIGVAVLTALPAKPNDTALRFDGYEISTQLSNGLAIGSSIIRLQLTLKQP